MAGRENSPINPTAILRLMTHPISAGQIAARLGRSSSSITHVINTHLLDQVECEKRLGKLNRLPVMHYWRKES